LRAAGRIDSTAADLSAVLRHRRRPLAGKARQASPLISFMRSSAAVFAIVATRFFGGVRSLGERAMFPGTWQKSSAWIA